MVGRLDLAGLEVLAAGAADGAHLDVLLALLAAEGGGGLGALAAELFLAVPLVVEAGLLVEGDAGGGVPAGGGGWAAEDGQVGGLSLGGDVGEDHHLGREQVLRLLQLILLAVGALHAEVLGGVASDQHVRGAGGAGVGGADEVVHRLALGAVAGEEDVVVGDAVAAVGHALAVSVVAAAVAVAGEGELAGGGRLRGEQGQLGGGLHRRLGALRALRLGAAVEQHCHHT